MSDVLRSTVVDAPIFAIGLTVGTYAGAVAVHRRFHRHPLLTPVMLTIVVVAVLLGLLGIDYDHYFAAVQPIHLLLGPATVALALPLVHARRSLHAALIPVLVSLGTGCIVAIASVWLLAVALGADHPIVLALLTKSVTTPVALGLAGAIGSPAPLAAVFTATAGVVGAVVGPSLLNLVGVRDPRARGFAIGVSAHGIGTARALQEGAEVGGWSSAGMVLNALATTALLPVLVHLVYG